MARIVYIEHWDKDVLFVPGTDPAQIVADGNVYLAANVADWGDEVAVVTPPEQVRVAWYRVNPCHCGDGHCGHWDETAGKTRGGFQGAMVTFDVPAGES